MDSTCTEQCPFGLTQGANSYNGEGLADPGPLLQGYGENGKGQIVQSPLQPLVELKGLFIPFSHCWFFLNISSVSFLSSFFFNSDLQRRGKLSQTAISKYCLLSPGQVWRLDRILINASYYINFQRNPQAFLLLQARPGLPEAFVHLKS